jgi:protein-S-isoprenylcysteine O-methyltransferase Ste14
MQRKKMYLWVAIFGALIVAIIVRLRGGIPLNIRDFGLGMGQLGRVQLVAAATPWVIFSLYWEAAAKNAAKAKSSESSFSRGIHVVLTNLALLLEIIQFPFGGRFLPASYFVIAWGCALTISGFFVAIWARRHLGRHWSGEITIKEEHELIRTGPYKGVRHPIYTGILIMYVGTAVVTGTWLALAGLAIALFAYWRKIRLEEANLRIAFGPEYDAYRRESWALAPGLF